MEVKPDLVDLESFGPPVELPFFSGPLDLLLHLIRKNKVSITDIPILSICDQYHQHLRAMRELDLEIAGEFLWMAALLLQLKSKALLPTAAADEPDPRDELVERLIAYRRVRELASILHDTDLVRRCVWPAGFDTELSADDADVDLDEIDLRRLAETYLEVMQRFAAAHPPPIEVLPLRYNVPDTMRELYREIRSNALVPLLRRLHERPDPEEVVVLFVSALELIRLRAARAEQRMPFAEIYLRPGDRDLDEAALADQAGEGGDGS